MNGDITANSAYKSVYHAERGEIMRINRELALDCPMAAQILSSSSRKKKELIVRLAETQLRALGYTQNQLRDSEDIRFITEMMERGFVSGCPGSERRRRTGSGRRGRCILNGRDSEGVKEKLSDEIADTATNKKLDGSPLGNEMTERDFKDDYLKAVQSILGDDEFGSMTEGEE